MPNMGRRKEGFVLRHVEGVGKTVMAVFVRCEAENGRRTSGGE